MLETTITQKEILSNKILKLGFSKFYKDNLEEFLKYLNDGANLDVKEILYCLIDRYRKCRINTAWKTVFYDFAEAVLNMNPVFWNDEEKSNGFAEIGNHLQAFYPEFDDSSDDEFFDVETFYYVEYFEWGMDIFLDAGLDEKEKSVICFSMFQFFQRWKFQFSKEAMAEERQVLKDNNEFYDTKPTDKDHDTSTRIIRFGELTIVKIVSEYFINISQTGNSIVMNNKKYYKVELSKLKKMGFKM